MPTSFQTTFGRYSEAVSTVDTYSRLSTAISAELHGIQHLLDVGNEGVFDYDTTVVPRITGIDLFLDQLPEGLHLPPNVEMEAGDALNIPKPNDSYDGVVMVMLLHHLVGRRVDQCLLNLDRAICEAARVLKPGGRLIIMESCVPKWFYGIEMLLFAPLVPVINATLSHPPAFQFTEKMISSAVHRTGLIETKRAAIPKGRHVLQFGFRVPSWLTPVQPTLFCARKP